MRQTSYVKNQKLILILFTFVISFNSFSQGGPKYSEDGNSLTSTSVLGSTNFMDLKIITNNQTRFILGANGDLIMPMLSSSSLGIMVLDALGKATKLNFTGNINHVLRGDGTFGNLTSAAGWVTTGSLTTTTNKVGIGITAPIQALEVNGKAIFNGSVSAEEFLVGDVSSSGQNLRISTSICLDGYNASTGMRNELCVFTQPLFLNSKPGVNYHTIINDANTGNVGIGTNNPLVKLHVNGNFKVDGESFYPGISHFSHIAPMPGDSIIRFGDSTLYLGTASHNIYVSSATIGSATNKGVGIGSPASQGKGLYSSAIGHQSRAFADYSYTMGYYVKANAPNSIVIGSGLAGTSLENSDDYSLVMGFNSNIPTFFIGSSSGAGTIGKVGIGTTNPDGDFQIKKSTSVDAWFSSTGPNPSNLWVSNSILAYNFRINPDGMGQISDGVTAIISYMHGNVGIGTTCLPFGHPYKLTVEGEIAARGLWIKTTPWCDFVFKKDYKLFTYNALRTFINLNSHLPHLPSQALIEKNEGYSLGEMNKAFAQTIEEQALYILDLDERNEFLAKKYAELEAKYAELELKVNQLINDRK